MEKWRVESGEWKVFFVLTGFRDFVLTKGCVMGDGLQGFEVLGRVVFDVLDEFLGFDDLDVVSEADDETGDATEVGDGGVEEPMLIVVEVDMFFGQWVFF